MHQQLHSLDCHFVHNNPLVFFTHLCISQGFIFEGDLQFLKLFKKTICKGVCTLKCTKKRFIPFTPPPPPPFPPLICPPYTKFEGSPAYAPPNVFYIHLSKTIRLYTPFPSILIPLCFSLPLWLFRPFCKYSRTAISSFLVELSVTFLAELRISLYETCLTGRWCYWWGVWGTPAWN